MSLDRHRIVARTIAILSTALLYLILTVAMILLTHFEARVADHTGSAMEQNIVAALVAAYFVLAMRDTQMILDARNPVRPPFMDNAVLWLVRRLRLGVYVSAYVALFSLAFSLYTAGYILTAYVLTMLTCLFVWLRGNLLKTLRG